MKNTLYLKVDPNNKTGKLDVALSDIAKVECTDTGVLNRVKSLRVLKIPEEKDKQYIVSILKIIEIIHQTYPDLMIVNLGPPEFIIHYETKKHESKMVTWMKVAVVALTSFFGAAFSIMTFNADASVPKIFGQIYVLVMGETSTGFTMLEISYCVGLTLGIIIFFNHFSKKKLSSDPTPIEVEMRLYEDDVNSAVIEEASRKEKIIDVD